MDRQQPAWDQRLRLRRARVGRSLKRPVGDRNVIAAFIARRLADGDALYSRPGCEPASGELLCEGRWLATFSQRRLLLAAERPQGTVARAAREELQSFALTLGVRVESALRSAA